MTEELIRKGMVVVQSSTVSVKVKPGSCNERYVTSPDEAHYAISIKVEEGTVIHTQEEEIPEPVLFPSIKAEPDEVRYMAVSIIRHIYLVGKLAVNAETSKYVLISHHQNVRQNPHLNINVAFHFAFVKT